MPIDSALLVPTQSYLNRHNPNASAKGRSASQQRRVRRMQDPEYKRSILDYNNAWRRKNRDKYNRSRKALRARRAAVIQEYKATHPCVRCGEADPVCLDFHHRDPKQKKWQVALMHHRALSVDKIMAEMAKCDILCSNCHRKLHAQERRRRAS